MGLLNSARHSLVYNGFVQEYKVDYEEIFAPAASVVRTLISISSS